MPAGQPRVIGNALAFIHELRGSGGGGDASVARCRASPGCCGVSPCACLGGTVLLDESPVNRGPDDLVGGNRHSVELTKARNQSWKPQDPVGLLRVHWVSCGRDPCKQ